MLENSSRRRFVAGLGVLGFGSVSGCLRRQDTVCTTLAQGTVQGTIKRGLRIFKGIPYAKPPVGPLRFLPPESADSWQGVWDATEYASAPIQPPILRFVPDRLFLGASTSEDCLYLNIWQPKTPGPHPVLVWVHGGGNIAGAASQIVDGSVFAENDIVFVSVGYRIGAFGFLELGALLGKPYQESCTNGLKDLTAALQWIQSNIAGFDGDPRQVTLFGASAGGKNIVSLMASPQSQCLFTSAIVQSGGQTIHRMGSANVVARQFADCVRALGADPANILSLSSELLNQAQQMLLEIYPRPFPFRTVIGTGFMPEAPLSLLATENRQCRLLIGTSRDESITFIRGEPEDHPISPKHLSNISEQDALLLMKGYAALFPELSSHELKVRFLTAEEYFLPSFLVANLHRNNSDVWMYQFAQAATSGPFEGWVAHGSDAPYIWNDFDNWLLRVTFGAVPESARGMAAEILARWCAFIKGSPPDSVAGDNWPKFDGKHVLQFKNNKASVVELNRQELMLWEMASLQGSVTID